LEGGEKMERLGVILEPRNNQWENLAVLNCGAAPLGTTSEVALLYRGVEGVAKGEFRSCIGLAIFDLKKEKVVFRSENPVIEPQDGQTGCEDPRVVRISDTFVVTYTGVWYRGKERWKVRPFSTQTSDYKSFTTGQQLLQHADKNAALFPEKTAGRYCLLHRPCSPKPPSVYLSFSDQIDNFPTGSKLFGPKYPWESARVGIGPPPIKTDKGWLLIYHGANKADKTRDRKTTDPGNVYRLGTMLLDHRDLRKILKRCPNPILEPTEDYEKRGWMPNVVFSCGAVDYNSYVYTFYGAADQCIGCVKYTKKELFEHLDSN